MRSFGLYVAAPAVLDLCFVQPTHGGETSQRLVPAIADLAASLGAGVRTVREQFPDPAETTIYVISSELLETLDTESFPDPDQLRRTIVLCTELPGSHLFDLTRQWARVSGGALILHGVPPIAFNLGDLPAARFDVGYAPQWDQWQGGEMTRARLTDVLYVTHGVPVEDAVLGHAAKVLDRRLVRVLDPTEPSVLHSDVVEAILHARLRLLPARYGSHFVDSLAVVLSVVNGCVVCAEHAANFAPLEPAVHLCCGTPRSLGFVAESLLLESERLGDLQREAYAFVRGELSMEPSVERLLGVAEAALARANPPKPRRVDSNLGESADGTKKDDLVRAEIAEVRVGLKHSATELRRLRRALSDLATRSAGETESVLEVGRTPAYVRLSSRVSVVMPVYNQSGECTDALESLVETEYSNFDVVVVDDASTDSTVSVLRSFMDARPWFPMVVLQHRVNGGPSRARNTGLAAARGELVLMLDADNGMYPSGLAKLVEALDENPECLFAYPVLNVQSAGQPAGLLGTWPWSTELLRRRNYIDTLALIRREELIALGGFREDDRLDGWEDWDLWCRCADRGHFGVHVPDVLAWYRKTGHSMLSVAEVDTSVARSLVENAYPDFFASSA